MYIWSIELFYYVISCFMMLVLLCTSVFLWGVLWGTSGLFEIPLVLPINTNGMVGSVPSLLH